jgi:hypothetical protein
VLRKPSGNDAADLLILIFSITYTCPPVVEKWGQLYFSLEMLGKCQRPAKNRVDPILDSAMGAKFGSDDQCGLIWYN